MWLLPTPAPVMAARQSTMLSLWNTCWDAQHPKASLTPMGFTAGRLLSRVQLILVLRHIISNVLNCRAPIAMTSDYRISRIFGQFIGIVPVPLLVDWSGLTLGENGCRVLRRARGGYTDARRMRGGRSSHGWES
jgi:hypothetical protein